MHLFSTIVFIDGNPVGYKVFESGSNRLCLSPAEHPSRTFVPPALTVTNVNGKWKIEGTANQKIIEQVLQELEQNPFLPTHLLSASP